MYLSFTSNITFNVFSVWLITGFSSPSITEYLYVIVGFVKSTIPFLNAGYKLPVVSFASIQFTFPISKFS